jgi:sec-independent protein translocase protein TatC
MLLAKAGIVRSTTMLAGWRYAVVGIALFAAFATPPDPISQLLLGTAMLLLYFISIGGMKMMEPKPDDTDSSDE